MESRGFLLYYIVIYKFNYFVLTTGIALSVSKAEQQVSGDRSPTSQYHLGAANDGAETRIDKALKVWRGREPVNLCTSDFPHKFLILSL